MGIGSAMAGGNPAAGREENDFYPTPWEVTQALLNEEKIEGAIWEPACGDGAIVRVLEANGHKRIIASDIAPQGAGKEADFLTIGVKRFEQNIITNPPFNLAEAFIRKAMSLDPSMLALVLKSTYWHAKRRKELFDTFTPSAIYPLLWRPDFLNKGGPTMEVMWCVWRRDHRGATIYKPLEKPTCAPSALSL